MRLLRKETKTAGDGAVISLVQDEQGNQYLFEPLGMTLSPKEKIFLETLRELRKIIRTPWRMETVIPVFSYLGIEKCEEETGLLLAYDEELWTNWPQKGQALLPPPAVVAVAQDLLRMVPSTEEEEPEITQFYPGDLVPMGDGRWGLLDPRVQQLLAPYRAGGEDRSLYVAPEVIGGAPRTTTTYLYSLGLTLFHLATGEFPFPVTDRRETVTAMLREAPLDPRYLQPRIGSGLANILLKMLSRKPQDRPEVGACAAALSQALEVGTLVAGPEEAARFQAKAGTVKAKAVWRRKWYWRWQRLKWPVVAALGVLLFALLFLSGGGYKEKITPATSPQEVVAIFYDGLARLDLAQLEEPLRKGVGREFSDMVSFLHVTAMVRQAYELIGEPFLELKDLTVMEAADYTADHPVFTAAYHLRIRHGEEWVEQERRDRLVLEKQKKKWQITALDSAILAEKRTPVTILDPVDSLDRSNGVR